MNKLSIYPLKVLKRLHSITNPNVSQFGRNWKMFPNKEYASTLISEALLSNKPMMIARLGSTELSCMINYLGVTQPEKYKNIKSYISEQTPPWWWNQSIINQMQNCAGFFPARVDKIEQFCALMIEDLANVDILGSWLKEESFFSKELSHSKKVMLEDLEPFFTSNPWTKALAGKKVLVVHPFVETIKSQYQQRERIFNNDLLPAFELEVIPAVQSIAGQKTEFEDWFSALHSMKEQIAKKDFDVCILGCGAYGFPLASFVKNMGKQAIHIGGATQLLFGIKGKRWEQFIVYPYSNLFNEHWVRPNQNETPKKSNSVEGGCYW
jgi:hypothetical protein